MPYVKDNLALPMSPTRSPCNIPEQEPLEPIAVIGFSLRMPQDAVTPQAFWTMLEEKKCAMTDWPKDRINVDAFYHPDHDRRDTIYARGAHFLKDDVASFDASFFSITSKEAVAMDPQQRILLETSYRALENAGIPVEKVSGSKTGVYTGSMGDDYRSLSTRDVEDVPTYSATGCAVSMLANRLSWFFNLRGPSINLDSACSSSLMALDFACQGLRNGDSSMALVAGANLVLTMDTSLSLTNMNFLSADSRCYSFDDRANGYSRGEGFGVVVIKRLSDAVRDGDTVRAVIRSTGSNQDGHTPGLTQPSKDAQAQLIKETYEKAGLDFAATRFFEAHGTGTAIGDPIEADAIASVFRKHRTPDDPLYIGAVKTNIGHLEGASGIAGLIKTIMVLEKGVIPPNANFENLNSRIDAEFSNLKIPEDCTPWPVEGLRRASVNSFGFGGSNSHVILEDALNFLQLRDLKANHCTSEKPPRLFDLTSSEYGSAGQIPEPMPSRALAGDFSHEKHNGALNNQGLTNGYAVDGNGHRGTRQNISNAKLCVWTAADEGGSLRLVSEYQNHFQGNSACISQGDSYMEDLAYTLGSRRSSLPWKSFAVVDSVNALSNIKKIVSKGYRSSDKLGIAFVFTGQGAQYKGMGTGLLRYDVFESTLRSIDEIFRSLGCEWSLFDKLFECDDVSNIDSPEYSQPLCTALQIALVELLRSFNIVPSAVVGHSSGEIAASYAVGGLSLHSACKVSYYRGRFAQELATSSTSPGAMMSVNLSETAMRSYIQNTDFQNKLGDVTVGCINSPDNVTVSGDEALIDVLLSKLNGDQIFARKLNTSIAYHSPRMQKIARGYHSSIQGLSKADQPSLRTLMISSLTGEKVPSIDVLSSADYWVSNLVEPVRFSQALSHAVSAPTSKKLGHTHQKVIYDLIEIGPHSTLKAPIKQILRVAAAKSSIRYHSVLSRHEPSTAASLQMVGNLYVLGYPVSLHEINQIPSSATSSRKLLVDLPEYPFNHTQTYWHEGRMSKDLRLRLHPRLDLLGTSTPESNTLEARWRKFFDIADTPWIDEHKVNGKTIYPAAGMISMALEGARQMAQKDQYITGYQLKDVTFSNPIPINPSGSKTETQLYLRPHQNTYEKKAPSFQFRICILDGSHWNEACQGNIQIQYQGAQSEVDGDREDSERSQRIKQRYEEVVRACNQLVKTEHMYRHFKDIGLTYGPAFQALQNLAWNGREEAIGEIQTPQWSTPSFQSPVQPHIIHPVTLDAAAQLMWVSLTGGATKLISTGVPTRMRKAWVSSTGLGYPDPTVLRGYSKSKFKGLRGTEASMVAVDQTGELKLSISGMETTNVSNHDTASNESSSTRKFCYTKDWKPDISLMTHQQILAYCEARDTGGPEPREFYQELELLLFSYVAQTLEQVSEAEVETAKPHIRKYFSWLKMQQTRSPLAQLPDSDAERLRRTDDSRYLETLADRLEASNAQGKLFVTIGRNLPSLIRGTVHPLELLFHTGIAEAYYQDVCKRVSCCRKIWNYLDGLAHKNPALRILEVGAGTGAMTDHVLAPLLLHGEKERGTARFARYDYTDISEAFFENARQKFALETQGIFFRTLNIENEPANQGFEVGTYDLIIAGSVLHATQDLNITIQNVRKLLKPGGKLVLFEITKPEKLRTGFGFGVLPGWWMSTETSRKWSPCLSSSDWSTLLSENQFSGVDFEIRDYQDESCHEMSLIVTTATEETVNIQPTPKTVVLLNTCSELQNDMARHICNELESLGQLDCEVLDMYRISRVKYPRTTSFILLTEIESSFLYDMDNASYTLLQTMLSIAHRLLWITHGNADLESSPKLDMVSGLARVLRSEDRNRCLITLALEDGLSNVANCAKSIVRVLERTRSNSTHDTETEFRERNGMLMIHRIVEAQYLDHAVHAKIAPRLRHQPFAKEASMVMRIGTVGLIDSLHWVEDPIYSLDLASDEIEIEVKAVGINFRDLFVALGRHDGDTLGCECAGVVTRIGEHCRSLRKGDQVCAVVTGCMNTYARCNTQLAVKFPADLSFVEAAALPLTGATAYNSLVEVARLQRGETVLIHAASGGTGQMAVQIAQSVGAEIFATVGFNEKKRLLMNLYGIPEDHIFYSRDSTFAQGIMRMTQDRGVDVVLNSLSGDSLTASWESVAPFGRFVEIGKSDIIANSKLSMSGFAKNVTFSAVAIDYTSTHRPDLLRRTLVAVVNMVENKSLKVAHPLHVYPASRIEEALRAVQSGKNTGKAVLQITPNDVVPTFLQIRTSYEFNPCVSYVIAGGLGGLGRSAATWMARRGAKNLILLSRSGGNGSEAAAKLVKDLKGLGIRVKTPKCDVASSESLASALAQCSDMPPIKGCIQGTMVLQDSIFENMAFANWTTTIRSKATSSWNLHVLLPRKLDFFIMLSSVASIIGSVSQANYAAGNAYQGALAQHRISRGEKAIALDLGWMGSVGIIAENEKYRRNKENAQDMAQIEETEFHALLDYYCDPGLELASPMKAEPIVGLVTAAQFRSRGLEPPDWMQWPAFSRLAQLGLADFSSTSSGSDSEATIDYVAEFVRAPSIDEASGVVVSGLVQKLARVLSGLSVDEIDVKKPLHAYGVDSLLAVELRNWFAKEFRAEVAIFDLMSAGSIAKIGEVVAERSEARKEGA